MGIDTRSSLRSGSHIGAHGARATPVPIPNTAVKPRCGYYTAFTRGKIARCRIIKKNPQKGFFFLSVAFKINL